MKIIYINLNPILLYKVFKYIFMIKITWIYN